MNNEPTLYERLFTAALGNPALCTGEAPDYQLKHWFGPHRTGITREEIVIQQASDYALLGATKIGKVQSRYKA